MPQQVRKVMTRNLGSLPGKATLAEAARPRGTPTPAVGVVSIGDLAIERDSDSALADISAALGNH